MVEYLAAHGAYMAVMARNLEKGNQLIKKVKMKAEKPYSCKQM